MIFLEMFMHGGNVNTMGALQMTHGGVASWPDNTNHTLIIVMKQELRENFG